MIDKPLNAVSKFLEIIGNTSWKTVGIFSVLIFVSVAGYVVYRSADHMYNSYENLRAEQDALRIKIEQFDAQEIFRREFKLEDLQFDLEISQYVNELRISTDADWVLLWGFHNGKTSGPIHLRRMSVVDESNREGTTKFFREFQDINVNLFVEDIIRLWTTDMPISEHVDDIQDRNAQIFYQSNGIYYRIIIPIYISAYDHPIAILGVYFQRGMAEIIRDDDIQREYIELTLQRKALDISFQFNRRIIDNQ